MFFETGNYGLRNFGANFGHYSLVNIVRGNRIHGDTGMLTSDLNLNGMFDSIKPWIEI